MYIETKTLVAVATPLLARVEALRAAQADYADCAFEALGMLQAFVRGYEEEEAAQVRHYEATAHIPDDEDSF